MKSDIESSNSDAVTVIQLPGSTSDPIHSSLASINQRIDSLQGGEQLVHLLLKELIDRPHPSPSKDNTTELSSRVDRIELLLMNALGRGGTRQ
ncbi:hypothetical protein BJ165DRAFT_86716 [Panaeolus papilionaceus]|nr:hypothetical protein BJ165DRAFT_86716 [Panaeolus papilionaceus]